METPRDDDEYLRQLASWLEERQDGFLQYSPRAGADVIVYDKLLESLYAFDEEINKY